MMRLAIAGTGVLLLLGCAAAPERPAPPGAVPVRADASVDEMCAVAQCARDVRIELRREDGTSFAETFDALPVVQEAGVSVYAGHTVLFEAEQRDGRLAGFRLVTGIVHPERTISARLEQDEKGHMMLTTENPFKQHLRIRMGIMPLEHDRLVRTSSCPVIAGGSSFEMWPYPVFQVFLGEPRLMAADEPMTCIE
jgi:hypothetical protein